MKVGDVKLAAGRLRHVFIVFFENFVETHVVQVDVLLQLQKFVANELGLLQERKKEERKK